MEKKFTGENEGCIECLRKAMSGPRTATICARTKENIYGVLIREFRPDDSIQSLLFACENSEEGKQSARLFARMLKKNCQQYNYRVLVGIKEKDLHIQLTLKEEGFKAIQIIEDMYLFEWKHEEPNC